LGGSLRRGAADASPQALIRRSESQRGVIPALSVEEATTQRSRSAGALRRRWTFAASKDCARARVCVRQRMIAPHPIRTMRARPSSSTRVNDTLHQRRSLHRARPLKTARSSDPWGVKEYEPIIAELW